MFCAGRDVAGENLVEMMVAVDQARQQNMARQIEDAVRRCGQACSRTDLLDDAVAGEQAGVAQLAPLTVHGHEHVGILRE